MSKNPPKPGPFKLLNFPVLGGQRIAVYPLYFEVKQNSTTMTEKWYRQNQPTYNYSPLSKPIVTPVCSLSGHLRSMDYTDITTLNNGRTSTNKNGPITVFIDMGLMNLIAANSQRIKTNGYTHVSYNHDTHQVEWLVRPEQSNISMFPPQSDSSYYLRFMSRKMAEEIYEKLEPATTLNYSRLKSTIQDVFMRDDGKKYRVLTWCRGDYHDDKHFCAININFNEFPNSVFCYQLVDNLRNPLRFSEDHTHIHYCAFSPFNDIQGIRAWFVLLVYSVEKKELQIKYIDLNNLNFDNEYLQVKDWPTKAGESLERRRGILSCMTSRKSQPNGKLVQNLFPDVYNLYVLGGEDTEHGLLHSECNKNVEVLEITCSKKRDCTVLNISLKKDKFKSASWRKHPNYVMNVLPYQRQDICGMKVLYTVAKQYIPTCSKPSEEREVRKKWREDQKTKDLIDHYVVESPLLPIDQTSKEDLKERKDLDAEGKRAAKMNFVGARARIAIIPREVWIHNVEDYQLTNMSRDEQLYLFIGGTNDILAVDNRNLSSNNYPHAIITDLKDIKLLESENSKEYRKDYFETHNSKYASAVDNNSVLLQDSDGSYRIRMLVPERFSERKAFALKKHHAKEEWVYVLELFIPSKSKLEDMRKKEQQEQESDNPGFKAKTDTRFRWQLSQFKVKAKYEYES